jgi:hypothetical protein
MYILTPSTAGLIYESVLGVLKQDPAIEKDFSVGKYWDRVSLIEFDDSGTKIVYDQKNPAADGFTPDHAFFPYPDSGTKIVYDQKNPAADGFTPDHAFFIYWNDSVTENVRQKLLDLIASEGKSKYFRNTIVGADMITIEKCNALTGNAVLYFENKK